MSELDISEVTRRTGVPASTLRFYEEKGLVRPIGRRGLKRVFNPNIVQRLSLIALGREAGFSLNEIAGMLALDGSPVIDRNVLLARADDIDETIQRLTAMRNGLRHAAACPAPSHMECPKFQKILRVVGKRRTDRP